MTEAVIPAVIRSMMAELLANQETISRAFEDGQIITVRLRAIGKEKRVQPARIEITQGKAVASSLLL